MKSIIGRIASCGRCWISVVVAGCCATLAMGANGPSPIVVGLNADMSTADAESGVAIERGARVALAEINEAGGVLGRPLELRTLDHRRNPARGIANMERLAADPAVVAVLGGKHTPVTLAELPMVHEQGIPYLIPWAAGTPIVDNGYEPNYVFRVSVRDAYAGGFLMAHAKKHGFKRMGLLLEQTGWGRSNEQALQKAASELGVDVAHVEWFNWGQDSHTRALRRFRDTAAEGIIFVGNAPDGVTLIRSMLELPKEERLHVISHWGIAGGDFIEPLGDALDDFPLCVLQTYSFFTPTFPERAERFLATWRRLFPDEAELDQIVSPAGVAHAYDLVHLLARAMAQAGTTERSRVRDELERIERHEGLVRNYDPPFTPDRHDALDPSDFRMATFVQGVIRPVEGY